MKPLVRYVCESAPKSFFWICTMIWVRTMIGMLKKSHCQFANRPFLSSPEPLYQNEVKCSAFDMEMTFHSHANKTHFHKKGWAFGLILKGRVLGTRKWPIRMKGNSKSISGNSLSPLGAQNKDLALLRQRYPLGLDYVCEAQAKEFKAISSLTECAPLLHNSIGCNSNLIPTIRSKGNDAYSVVTQATRRKNLETGLISTHSLVHLQKQRLHYCTSTFYKRPAPSWLVAQFIERCTGIAEVKGSNPVQAWIFSGFLFATAKVASITATIFFHIILLQTVKQLHQSYLLYGTKFDGRGHRVSGKSIITVMAPCTCA